MVPAVPVRFSVNLQRGTGEDCDVYFHFNPRFNEETPVVVRNTRSAATWGQEEREGDFPFVPGGPFLLVITAFSEGYEVEVNGVSFTTFAHREGLVLTSVTHLCIHGDVVIRSIHTPIPEMPKHLRVSIPGKIKNGDIFTIRGTVPPGAERFVLNLQAGPGSGDDIVYHFNPRFADGVVVRNSRQDETWGDEEREGPLPLAEGDAFTINIAASAEGYKTWVNGAYFVTFGHRLDAGVASTLSIEGDVNVRDIWIDTAAGDLPPELGIEPRNFQGAKLELFHPEKPVCTRIPEAMIPGRLMVVSGVVDQEPSRFKINLQTDTGDGADVALHINPRFQAGDDVIVLNSKDGDAWQDEIRISEPFPFIPGRSFDLQILCTDDHYKITVNGQFLADFAHRLDFTRTDYIAVDGSIAINRIIVA